jgi:hypothetical protein
MTFYDMPRLRSAQVPGYAADAVGRMPTEPRRLKKFRVKFREPHPEGTFGSQRPG